MFRFSIRLINLAIWRSNLKPLLEICELEVTFETDSKSLVAVDRVSYDIFPGETVGLVGESGCGKSVTSQAIMGLLPKNGSITHGSILFNGQDLTTFDEYQMQKVRGGSLAMIFQEPMTALNPVMKVGHQILEQLLVHKPYSKKEAIEHCYSLLEKVGIPDPIKRFESYPHELSGGMRQRVMIAMALCCEPKLLIADEPTTALDVTIQAQVVDLLLKLQEEYGMAIQFISHDLGVISEICDRVVIMYGGRLVEKATAEELFACPRHPYSKGLLASVPKINQTEGSLYAIPGTVPSLAELGVGCAFYNRCPKAIPECLNQAPKMAPYGGIHQVACYRPEGGGFL
jgi:peptide/nickel transport system ATP-binding protein